MGISTKVAKRIWRHWSVQRQGKYGRLFVTSTVAPDYAVVVDLDVDDRPMVVTVLFHVHEEYVRAGNDYQLVEAS